MTSRTTLFETFNTPCKEQTLLLLECACPTLGITHVDTYRFKIQDRQHHWPIQPTYTFDRRCVLLGSMYLTSVFLNEILDRLELSLTWLYCNYLDLHRGNIGPVDPSLINFSWNILPHLVREKAKLLGVSLGRTAQIYTVFQKINITLNGFSHDRGKFASFSFVCRV